MGVVAVRDPGPPAELEWDVWNPTDRLPSVGESAQKLRWVRLWSSC
jgi:hypothetical protein